MHHHLFLPDKLLQASDNLVRTGLFCCDLAVWLLVVPSKLLAVL
jgi:hypothetical protein